MATQINKSAQVDYAAKTNALLEASQTEADVAAKLAAAIEEFAGYGRIAASADGVTTTMAFRFDELRRAGILAPKQGVVLYKAYAEARGSEFASSNSYAAGLSTFETFGLQWVTAFHVAIGGAQYAAVKAVRDMVENKKLVPSLYQSYVLYNRKVHKLAESEGVDAVVATFGDAEKRDAWIRSWLINADAAEETDTLKRLAKLVAQVEKWAKRDDVAAVATEMLALAKSMEVAHTAMVAKRTARAVANEAYLVKASEIKTLN